ncbi:Hcp family type VI secretion system effector [Pseudomonas sp. JDS28PS106]|uniref:Hcp family type VI secretion system effector n=1 Tax=Pseudomonas sp. JDS28PS106 TaxID=2497235 RepID=UPI002FD07285
MAMPAYMSVIGKTQKEISKEASSEASLGQSFQQEYLDQIQVIAFEHSINVPRDPLSGSPTGKRVHEAMRVTKRFDKASPLLMQALARTEILEKVTLDCYRPSNEGAQLYYQIILEDATIVKIRDVMPDSLEADRGHRTHLQEVSFAYKKIIWKHEIAGTEAEDDWSKSTAN